MAFAWTAAATGSMPSSEATTTTSSMTVGMKIDAVLNRLDSMSSTELYWTIVMVTILITYMILGGRPTTDMPDLVVTSSTSSSSAVTGGSSPVRRGGPQPRWHIFKWVNYVVAAAFSWTVVAFSLAYYRRSDDPSSSQGPGASSFPTGFLIVWSIFLCYFLGFFGVSFVHDVLVAAEEEENDKKRSMDKDEISTVTGLGDVDGNINSIDDTDCHALTCKRSKLSSPEKRSKTRLHDSTAASAPVVAAKTCPAPRSSLPVEEPTYASSAPVCSDPASFHTKTKLSHEDIVHLSDEDIAELVLQQRIKDHELEKLLRDAHRAVAVRRVVVSQKLLTAGRPSESLQGLPAEPSLDYGRVHGANCEIVVGYLPLPVGLVGPLVVNGVPCYVPMATTEGCLVASTNRGAKAITAGGGAHAEILRDGITRAPCVRCPSAMEAARLKLWCERPDSFAMLKEAFESTTSFGKLQQVQPTVAGRNVYLRLQCFSGDAMGMNMVSKGSLAVIECLKVHFPEVQLVALSGNMCTDKKAAAVNWLEGRGKSVVVEATIPAKVVRSTLKTTVKAMVHTNLHKNLIGSAMAGAIGGFNAHASNIVTAVFLATGQDPAQNVESSNCITLLEETDDGDLWISCTMPSIEVGTVGGGTSLQAQAACLEVTGCRGGSRSQPGRNARRLAQIVAAATMAGELSLLAALAANTLVQAHMQHNRKKVSASKSPTHETVATTPPAPSIANNLPRVMPPSASEAGTRSSPPQQ